MTKKGKIIGIISLKGGVGKTTTTANLSAILSKDFKKKVLAVDANFTAPNLGLHLGIVDAKHTLHDVLLNKSKLNEAIHQHEAGFHVIPGAFVSRKVNPFRLKQELTNLKNFYDVILLDSSPNLNEEVLATMIASDELLVVTSPDYPTLSTTLRAIRLAKQKKTPITGLIINKTRNKKFELRLNEIEETAGVPVLSVIPDDIRVLEALAATNPVSLHHATTNATIEMKKLAASLVGEEYKDPRMWSRVKELFRRDESQDHINRQTLRNERK
jgi:septum site-determining protein MinD